MRILLGFFGMVCSLFLLKYRERVGDMIGDAEWMNKLGGIYNIVIIFAVLLFFFSIATMTGTQEIFLTPILWLLPGVGNNAGIQDF